MNKPIISERFDLDDIRAIREYNALRHAGMTPAEIVADTREGASSLMRLLQTHSPNNQVKVLSAGHAAIFDAPASCAL